MNLFFKKFLTIVLFSTIFVYVFSQTQTIQILHTSDEHGWFLPSEYNRGAAGMYALWESYENFSHENYLILSGGDNWTGTAVSTWAFGVPMAKIMNKMGYRASALGNHEFDFSVDTLKTRLSEISFPFLAANVYYKNTQNVPDFVEPYIIVNYKDIKIGIIGLANIKTPSTTMPEFVENLDFTDYEEAIIKYAPKLKQQNVEMIIVLTHICGYEAKEISKTAAEHGIDLITTGHCHRQESFMQDGVLIVGSGSFMSNYTYIEYEYDLDSKKLSLSAFEIKENKGDARNHTIDSIANAWDEKANKYLRAPLGYTSETIPRRSPQMENMIADAWLHIIPEGDVSVSNSGGVRQDIFKGAITLETVMGLLPFDNKMITLQLSGKQLIQIIEEDEGLFVGGFSMIDTPQLLDGTPIENNKIYTVITTDYLYMITDKLQEYDASPQYTDYTYRQPVADWIERQNTNKEKPLNSLLDNKARR